MTDPLTSCELLAIRKRLDRCVAGPWIHRGDGLLETRDHQTIGVTCSGSPNCSESGVLPRAAHAEFLAAAREDIPRLLEEVERLQAEVERLQNLSVIEPRRLKGVPSSKVSIHLGINQ